MMQTTMTALPAYPCSYDLECIVSVAATDRNDDITGFSNYGETAVDLGAPGFGNIFLHHQPMIKAMKVGREQAWRHLM